jgi:hypothetical protein
VRGLIAPEAFRPTRPRPGAPANAPSMVGFGHYHETYVKSEAGWQIATQKVTRLRIDRPGQSS